MSYDKDGDYVCYESDRLLWRFLEGLPYLKPNDKGEILRKAVLRMNYYLKQGRK
jgi:hypothetical protein